MLNSVEHQLCSGTQPGTTSSWSCSSFLGSTTADLTWQAIGMPKSSSLAGSGTRPGTTSSCFVLLLLLFWKHNSRSDLTSQWHPKVKLIVRWWYDLFYHFNRMGLHLTGPAMEQPILPLEQLLWTFMPNWYKCYKHVYHFLLALPQLILQSIYVSTLTQIGFFSNLHTSTHLVYILEKNYYPHSPNI